MELVRLQICSQVQAPATPSAEHPAMSGGGNGGEGGGAGDGEGDEALLRQPRHAPDHGGG